MEIQIDSDDFNVIFTLDDDTATYIRKDDIKLVYLPLEEVAVFDKSGRQQDSRRILINYQDVTNVVLADGLELLALLVSLKDSDGSMIDSLKDMADAIAAGTPLRFLKDATLTDVEIDIATPANNEPLPISMYNIRGEMGVAMNPFGITQYDNQTGARAIVDQNGAIKFGEAIILDGDVLYGQDLSSQLWTSLEINGGTTVGGVGEQTLHTNTTADGQVILQTAKRARFMISQFNIAHFGIQLNSDLLTDPDTIAEWGCVDFIDGAGTLNAQPNGIFMRVQGHATDPVWSIISVKNGVENVALEGSWNGQGVDNFNPSPDLSVYEIQYNAGTAIFFQGANFLHRLAGLTSTYAATYHFPVALRVRNINGNTASRTIGSRAAGTYRLGEERGETISRAFTTASGNFTSLVKTGAGYIAHASLSRTGSSGGNGTLEIFDGVDDTGILILRIDVGGDDIKGHAVNATFSNGLFIRLTGSGTKTANISFE